MRYLVLHGFTGTPETVSNLGLPEGCLTPTLGGHLGTQVIGGFWDEVERLAQIGRDCAGLLGYSLGGRLALGLLARYPERFEHAVIVSAHPGLESPVERTARRDHDARFVELLRKRGLEAFVDAWQALPLWATQRALSESTRLTQRKQRLRHSAEGLAASLLAHGLAEMPDLRPQLTGVVTEVDLVIGECDEKFATLGRELVQLIPQSRLVAAAGAGHNLLLERPTLIAQLLA